MKNIYNQGITALEILLVLSVLGVIFLIVIPHFSTIREMQVLKSGTEDILSSINKARGYTLSSLNSSEYGVHFQSDKVIIFKGKVFSDVAGDNENISLTDPAVISDVTLGGVPASAGDFYFNRLSGAPSATGTITISSPSFSKVITISATGSASSN